MLKLLVKQQKKLKLKDFKRRQRLRLRLRVKKPSWLRVLSPLIPSRGRTISCGRVSLTIL